MSAEPTGFIIQRFTVGVWSGPAREAVTRTRGVDALRRQTDARSYGGACLPVSTAAANTSLHRSSRTGFGRTRVLMLHACVEQKACT